MGAPLGNQNARKGGFSEAVARAADLEDPASRRRFLDAIAHKLVEKANAGDIAAIKEFGDRHDGKAHQSIDNRVSGDLTVTIKNFVRGGG